MPGDLKFAVAFRGTEEYRAALDALARDHGFRSANALAKHLIAEFARRKKVQLPEPAPPWGRQPGEKTGR